METLTEKTTRILATLEIMLLLAQRGQETESLVTDGLRFRMVRIVTGLNQGAECHCCDYNPYLYKIDPACNSCKGKGWIFKEIRAWDCAVMSESVPLTGIYPWRNALARKHDASPEIAVESVIVITRERLLHPDHPGPNCVCGPCESRWIH